MYFKLIKVRFVSCAELVSDTYIHVPQCKRKFTWTTKDGKSWLQHESANLADENTHLECSTLTGWWSLINTSHFLHCCTKKSLIKIFNEVSPENDFYEFLIGCSHWLNDIKWTRIHYDRSLYMYHYNHSNCKSQKTTILFLLIETGPPEKNEF